MTVTLHNKRILIQHTRPSDAGLPFAESPTVAADMLRRDVPRLRMKYDIEAGRELKRIVADGGSA